MERPARFKVLILFSIFLSCHQLYGQDGAISEKKGAAGDTKEHRRSMDSSLDEADSAQTKSTFDKQAFINEAKVQLASMSSKLLKELVDFCKKNSIKGEFVVDLTLEGRGKVLTVFMVSGSEDNIAKKNLLKNKLAELRFENIKIPKKEKVKFRYTLQF